MKAKNLIKFITKLGRTNRHTAISSENRMLTISNWLIGPYILEFEQRGTDRAYYGANLIPSLAKKLRAYSRCDLYERNLYLFCEFFSEDEIAEFISKDWAKLQSSVERYGHKRIASSRLPASL